MRASQVAQICLSGNFVMSACAKKQNFARSPVTLVFAVVSALAPVCGQNNPVPPAQVDEVIARIRMASASDVTLSNALLLSQRLLFEKRYSEANELFKALLEKWPREAAALYGAALATFNLGRRWRLSACPQSSRKSISRELLTSPAKSPWQGSAPEWRRLAGLLAVILGVNRADAEALKMAERAAALAPEHFDAQFTLGRALYSVGDSTAAVKAFRAAVALKPDDAGLCFFLRPRSSVQAIPPRCACCLPRARRREPQAAEGHLGLGVLLTTRGGADTEKGIQELKSAVRIDPNLYEAQVTLGRALLARKMLDESVEHLQRASELAPNNPEPHYQLALAYRRLGLTEKAAAETAIVKRIHEKRRGRRRPE